MYNYMWTRHFSLFRQTAQNGGQMKLTRGLLSLSLIVSVAFVSFLGLADHTVIAEDGKIALQRGYRAGYSDGYMAGYQDTLDKLAKDYSKHDDYKDGTRAYNQDFG